MNEPMSSHAPSGLPCCAHLHWGAHFCHLYETLDDLIDTLVPFFVEGLRNNELCLWIPSAPLDAAAAASALRNRVPEFDAHLARGQMHIVERSEWDARPGRLAAQSQLQAWIDAEQAALAAGYTGLRASGNVTFLKSREEWHDFERYEAQVTQAFAGRRVLGLCSYPLRMANGSDVLDVMRNHEFTIARRNGNWEVIESSALKAAKEALHEVNQALEERVAARTTQLSDLLATMEAQKRELEQALTQHAHAQRQLEEELADAHLLHEISSALLDEEAVHGLYERLLEVASQVMRSDFASMQRFHQERDALELLAYRGFPAEVADRWQWVRVTSSTICGATLRTKNRVIAYDVETSPEVDADNLALFRRSGICSVQSTPLLSRSGTLLGVISTHWNRPHRPSERDLRVFDVVARQAADLIERTSAQEALRLRARQLVEADRRKDEFLATLAHELRNPLAPIQNGLAVLKMGQAELLPHVLPMMERQLIHMVRLIDDLLDVSRVSRGVIVLKRERIRLQTAIESAVETSRPWLEAAEHRLSIAQPAQPVWLEADLTRVAQVFSNVLNNAAKYTPRGGRIELSAELSGESAVIRISDTGIGIPKPMLGKIFDVFAQVEQAMDRAQGGLGLGLSLAKRLAEMHEGSIEAQSEGPGKGATFIIRLPVAQAHAVPVASPVSATHPVAAAGETQMRVLVVDDNADAAESFAVLLSNIGYQVRAVSDPTSALGAALEFEPEVVFLDLGMPYLNGFELAVQLRGHDALRDAVLVAVSGWGAQEDRRHSREAGIDHHLTKPVYLRDIQALLAQVAARRPRGVLPASSARACSR